MTDRGRVPPHDLEAEESLLGAMLLSQDVIADVAARCKAEDFYAPKNGAVFAAIISLYRQNEPADVVTVADEMKRQNTLDMLGTSSYLLSLQINTASIANGAHYANIVTELAALRRLIGVAGEIAELGYSAPEDVRGALDRAEAMVFDVAQHGANEELLPWNKWMVDSVYEMSTLAPQSLHGVTTGFSDLDKILGGLQQSNLVIIGARPAMGKTSLALALLMNAALKDVPVLMFSLEMSAMEIMLRVVGTETHVDTSRLRSGRSHPDDWIKIDNSLQRLGDLSFYLNDSPSVSVMDMRSQARRLQAKGGLGLVVVDYLQLMTAAPGQRVENRVNEVSQISRGLKIMARELNVPVVGLSQLSRGLESREDKRPLLSDLRESGSLEQDADVVMFIYREDAYHPDTPTNQAELIIAKHRNGPTGVVRLAFIPQEATFKSLATSPSAIQPTWEQGF